MSKKMGLQWSEFKENANTLIENLRDDSDFTYITLACEDGKQIDAHRVIQAASSPIFKSLLAKQDHPNPLIFMRGTDSANLAALAPGNQIAFYKQTKVLVSNRSKPANLKVEF